MILFTVTRYIDSAKAPKTNEKAMPFTPNKLPKMKIDTI